MGNTCPKSKETALAEACILINGTESATERA